jgi:hypothetical protein
MGTPFLLAHNLFVFIRILGSLLQFPIRLLQQDLGALRVATQLVLPRRLCDINLALSTTDHLLGFSKVRVDARIDIFLANGYSCRKQRDAEHTG